MTRDLQPHHVVTFYRFSKIADPASVRESIECRVGSLGCRGTVLIAEEGVNATLSHPDRDTLAVAVNSIQREIGVDTLECKWSTGATATGIFHRLKARVRRQIVTFDGTLTEQDARGELVSPTDWNGILEDESIPVVDIRNRYETEIGRFEGARDLNIENFRDLQEAIPEAIPWMSEKAVAIYCTGGIRCEKASRWMLNNGFSKVYQLRGGILGYFQQVSGEQSRWDGECFVFDQRIAVTPDLNQGTYTMCHACRSPVSPEQRESRAYQEGVSCPHCEGKTSSKQRRGFKERVKQMRLAERSGISHIGPKRRAH